MTVRLIGHEESFEVRYTSANEPTFVDNAAKLISCDLFRPARRPWPLRGPADYRAGLICSRGCLPNKNICSWLSPKNRSSLGPGQQKPSSDIPSISRYTLRACWIAWPMPPSRPVSPAIRFRCKTCNPMKASLQRSRTGAAISSSWHRTDAADYPQLCSV